MGSWEVAFDDGQLWPDPVANDAAKAAAAAQMAERLRPGDVVGVGSGSTSMLTIEALAARAGAEAIAWTAVPTSLEVELTCAGRGIATASLSVLRPDWSFDGADEVDPAANLIKGRGGALLREKLVEEIPANGSLPTWRVRVAASEIRFARSALSLVARSAQKARRVFQFAPRPSLCATAS